MQNRVVKVPQVMQMEALECGAACLTMILAYYGRWVPLEKVRADCGVSRDGSKASNMLKAARSYGLSARGYSYSAEALRMRVPLPCIVFWNFNHFVVVTGFKGNHVYINDPARGQLKITMEEFENSFTGIVLTFEPTDAFEPGGTPPDTLRFALDQLRGLGIAVAFVMVTAAITSVITIINTSLDQVFLDHIISGDNPDWLIPLIAILGGLALMYGVVSIINQSNLSTIEGKIAIVSSSRFMQHLLHLPLSFYSQRMVGDLQQRQSANEGIAFALVEQLAPVAISGGMLALYLFIMVRYSLLLTAVGVLTVVGNALLARFISTKRINIARQATANNGKLYGTTVSGIEMIETIKAAGAEAGYFEMWSGYQAAVNDGLVRTTRIDEYLGALPVILTEIANILVLALGIVLIVQGELTSGALVAFTGFLTSFMTPVNSIIDLGQALHEMRTQMERIDDVMRYEVDVPENTIEQLQTTEFEAEKLAGNLDIEHITFGYSPLEPPLIKDFSLHLKHGQWVALVGSSGCGKSTIAKLVGGLYEPWEGEILFDGTPLKEVQRLLLRSSLAVVDQDIVTFDDSVEDNVRLWDQSIEDYEVILACRDASIHEEVAAREGGYISRILPGGRNYSGGQLQRLEIARVLAQDPTIIILDEATSALDSQTEAEIIQRIHDRGITCIVVAHRLSTIRDCDEIIMLDEGQVIERGTYEELMAKDAAFANLVRSD